MKYPITVTADGYALRRPAQAALLTLSDVWRFAVRHWGLLAALAITIIVHAPTLRYFFDGDDFVVLGSIRHSGGQQYLIDTVRMQDIVPNWRPLTAVAYVVEWKLFGMNALGWRAVNLGVHLTSMALLYALVVRVTRRPAIGAMSALIFGVSGAHFDTVNYVTAFPHIAATALILASLLAIVTYAQDGERGKAAYAASFALFFLAFLTNEGSFVYAPLIVAAYALFARRWRTNPRPVRGAMRLIAHAAPFAIVATGWLIYYEAFPNPQLKFDGYYWGGHVVSNYAVYLSFIAFPAQHIPLDPNALRWTLAGVMMAMSLFFLVRGPHVARVCVAGMTLAILPYAPVSIWTASRYTYTAVAFFAPVAAIAAYWLYDSVRRQHRMLRVPATVLGLLFVAAVASLYGWQTYAQDRSSGLRTDRWQLLVNELQENNRTVPAGTTIWIVDGPWTNPMEQYTWVPSVAAAVYGDARAFDLPRSSYQQDPPSTQNAIFLEWRQGEGLVPVPAAQVLGPAESVQAP
jgi:hypothetical protein